VLLLLLAPMLLAADILAYELELLLLVLAPLLLDDDLLD